MFLNEFLKEHRKVEELEKQVEKLTAGLHKVSAEVEMSRQPSRWCRWGKLTCFIFCSCFKSQLVGTPGNVRHPWSRQAQLRQ